MRRLLVGCAAVAGLYVASSRPAGAQAQSAFRFHIAVITDSTFSFPTTTHRWVKRGMRGIAVDPLRRDALVARFEVTGVGAGQATALVTGQTTKVTADHVALIERPAERWYQRSSFWLGTLLGAVVGAVVGGQ